MSDLKSKLKKRWYFLW